ncbi:GNAT family N-acetyltransferase [Angustibacter sp. McL0619]|uniref:GNAT family N-acetyltransferase n=1 Tax=Angustibacter sp. McL0619 TaxID=3415676 RepID=UPI003CE809D0
MTTTIRRIGPDDAQDADLVAALGALLADRHRAHRIASPLLDPAYEDATHATQHLRAQLADEQTAGAVGLRDGRPVGYLIGRTGDGPPWGPSVWMESGWVAAPDAELLRDLYTVAAQDWVDAGRVAHYVLVPASSPELVDGFFRLGFGLQHVHGIREPARCEPWAGAGTIRPATRDDIPALAALDRALPLHQGRSPVFAAGHLPTLEEAREEWEEEFDDDRFTTLVADVDGEVLGSAMACALELSGLHRGPVLADHAGFLGFAAVLPAARGRRLGRALGEAVIDWAAQSGYRSVAADWRATNLLSSRTWPRLGFEPTFLRLHRLIGH